IAPKEAGRICIGPDHRLFTMTFWHHFHWLWSIQRALLCQAMDTLELGDFLWRGIWKSTC
ncbi:hypothetical protein OG21DRAFT_1414158, partial [Imleria badia]